MHSRTVYKPKKLDVSKQWLIAGLLVILLTLSRVNYFPYLQDASWAIFFLVGFYLRNYIGLPLIIIIVVVIDFVQIAARGGHQDYFLAPSYFFIIPAYSALWFCGRFFAHKYAEDIRGLILFLLSAIIGIIACQLISSGGYYWLSMNVIELNAKEFISRTLEYLPLALQINLLYLVIVAVIHLTIVRVKHNFI